MVKGPSLQWMTDRFEFIRNPKNQKKAEKKKTTKKLDSFVHIKKIKKY